MCVAKLTSKDFGYLIICALCIQYTFVSVRLHSDMQTHTRTHAHTRYPSTWNIGDTYIYLRYIIPYMCIVYRYSYTHVVSSVYLRYRNKYSLLILRLTVTFSVDIFPSHYQKINWIWNGIGEYRRRPDTVVCVCLCVTLLYPIKL